MKDSEPKGYYRLGDPASQKDAIRDLTCEEVDTLLASMKSGGEVRDVDVLSVSQHVRMCKKHE